jgi:lipopolysaccharide transport system ATP-binding protein
VTTPTTGVIRAKGRIASLLEVGTGFHPEMTGRENIYMNGAIMGMTKAEIRRKLDEIVEFAGVARYIDTPAKRYSSGMTVRLGFAVAAHLEPEILVVDEVLAVGDAEFQKKAIGKMQDVSRNEGRTVLFVSHNMAAVKSLCRSGILLSDGEILETGNAETVVNAYLKGNSQVTNHKAWDAPEFATTEFELLEIGIKAQNKSYTDVMRMDDELVFTARYRIKIPCESLHLTLHFKDEQGNKLFSNSWGKSGVSNEHETGMYECRAVIPANFFNWGAFYIDFFVVKDRQRAILIENDIISFSVANKEFQLGRWMGREPGSITPCFDWQKEKIR